MRTLEISHIVNNLINKLQHFICENSQVLPNLCRTESLMFSMFFQSTRNWPSKITNFSSFGNLCQSNCDTWPKKFFLTLFVLFSHEISNKEKRFIHGIIYQSYKFNIWWIYSWHFSNPINLQFDLLPTELAGRRKLSKSQNRSVIAITYYIPLNFRTAVGHVFTPFQ